MLLGSNHLLGKELRNVKFHNIVNIFLFRRRKGQNKTELKFKIKLNSTYIIREKQLPRCILIVSAWQS